VLHHRLHIGLAPAHFPNIANLEHVIQGGEHDLREFGF
jgi:hypothetical protein